MGKKSKFTLEKEKKMVDFVKNNEVLFNIRHKSFRDVKLKNRLWLELANELHVDMSTLKKKWKSMRDYYINLKRKKTTGLAVKSSKREEALSFLDGTLTLKRSTTSKIDTEEVPHTPGTPISKFEEHDLESIFSDSQSLPSFTERYYVSKSPVSTNDILRDLISSRPKTSEFHPPPRKKTKVTRFFDLMSETVVKFSDVAIARTKMKIAQIVLEEEVKWAEEEATKKQQQNSQHFYLLDDQIPITCTSSSSSSDVNAKKSQEKKFE